MFSMDHYRGLPSFRGVVRQDAFWLRQILGDPMFGEFESRLYEDDAEQYFGAKFRTFLLDASAEDELLFYFGGHAEKTPAGEVVLAAVDWKRGGEVANQVTTAKIVDWVLRSRASQTSFILDCCYSSHLVEAFEGRLLAEPTLAMELLKAERSVQALVSGNQSRTDGLHTALTQALLNGIRTGAAGGRRHRCNLFDLREHAATTVRSVNTPRTYGAWGVERQHLIASNPHQGETLPRDTLIDLWSGDTRRVEKAVTKLIWTWGNSPALQVRANEVLHHFADTHPAVVPEIQQLLDSWKTGRAARRSRKEHTRQILLIYNSRNFLSAAAAQAAFGTDRPRPRMFDLDLARNYQFNDISLMNWIEGGGRSLWFLDGEAARHLVGRDRDLALALESCHAALAEQAIYWVEPPNNVCPDVLLRANLVSVQGQSIEAFVGQLLDRPSHQRPHHIGRGAELDGPPAVRRDSQTFLQFAREHDRRLSMHSGMKAADTQFPVREPKFLLLRQGESYVLAICDIEARVRQRALRRSYEPEVASRLATAAELDQIGFPGGAVDPMFVDPYSLISRIYIDGSIFFQHLMFPRSLIRIPTYMSDHKDKVDISVSTFIRTLQQIHGEQRVVFASIVERPRKPDILLTKLLETNFTFTRFAPSPSNSLHIGSLRTALLSYLFALLHPEKGRFHVRFDDTDTPAAEAAVNMSLIEDDLRWAGFGNVRTYRQTSKGATENYRKILELFQLSGFCIENRDGSIQLRVNDPDHTICYWFDLKRGPQIRHIAPAYSSHADKRQRLDYSLTSASSDHALETRFKYKFAGAVDDILHNSLVIRDVRQDHSFFTARQAVIISLLREALAFPRDDRCRKLADEIRQVTKYAQANRSQARPFPFPCPPLYLHVTRVQSEKGGPLSKRNLRQEDSLVFIREQSLYLPETLIVWCLLSFGGSFLKKIGCRTIAQLVDRVGREGPAFCISSIAGSVSFADLAAIPQTDTVRIQGLRRIDHRLLTRLSPLRFGQFASELYASRKIAPPLGFYEFVGRLYEHRGFISGASELAEIILSFARYHGRDLPESLVTSGREVAAIAHSLERSPVGTLSSSSMACLRFFVLGRMEGPPIRVLRYILGESIFKARALEGSTRCATEIALSS